MITQEFKRGCGHTETLEIDETSPHYEKKLACIARTRCKACVQALYEKQAKAAEARKEKRHQEALDGIRRHAEKEKVRESGQQDLAGSLAQLAVGLTEMCRALMKENGWLRSQVNRLAPDLPPHLKARLAGMPAEEQAELLRLAEAASKQGQTP